MARPTEWKTTAKLLGVALCLIIHSWAIAAPSIRIEGLAANPSFSRFLEVEALAAYEKAAQWFGIGFDSLITIAWNEAAPHAPVAGVAHSSSGTIELFAPALAHRPDRLRPVILHEMCHLHMYAATMHAELAPPRWLDEGLAMWISGTWDLGFDWRADNTALLTDAAAAGTILPFNELDASFPQGPYFPLAYAQSHSFIAWLVEAHGEESLRTLLRRLDHDEDFEAAFANAFQQSFIEAERDWRSSVTRRGPFGFLPSGETLWIMASVIAGLAVLVRFIQVRWRLARQEEPTEG